jgi:hypothetical protein
LSTKKPQLSQDEIWKLLEGHKDVLTPLAATEEAFFKRQSCPGCGSDGLKSRVNTHRFFSPGAALPNKLLFCERCETEFDPYTKMITRVPASVLDEG